MDEIQRLKDRVAELEELLGMRLTFPKLRVKGVRQIGWPILGVLLRYPLVSKEFIFSAVYGDRLEVDQPNLLVIATHISRLNKALRPYEIQIECQYGEGYFLSEENKERLNALVGMEKNNSGAVDATSGRVRHSRNHSVEAY